MSWRIDSGDCAESWLSWPVWLVTGNWQLTISEELKRGMEVWNGSVGLTRIAGDILTRVRVVVLLVWRYPL